MCRRVGDHYGCAACFKSRLSEAQEIDGNKLYECVGNSVEISHCLSKWNQFQEEQYSGCRVCETGYMPTGTGSHPIHFTCVLGTTANCDIYHIPDETTNNVICRVCKPGYYRSDTLHTCTLVPDAQLIDNCSAYREIPNTTDIGCEVCAKDYGPKNDGTCGMNEPTVGCLDYEEKYGQFSCTQCLIESGYFN